MLYLDMPTSLAVENLRRRESDTHTHGDIHEVDTEYLTLCRRTALAAAKFCGWLRVPCVDGAGALRPVEDIHREVWDLVYKNLGNS